MTIDAVSDKGKKYSVLESSLLATEVSPDYLAAVEGRRLAGRNVGKGKLSVTFDDRLKKQIEFSVELYPGLDGLVVTPKHLDMVVGQITDLNVVSDSSTPIRVSSANARLVEINGENRLIGRAVGKTKVEVAQGNQRKTINVKVTSAEFLAMNEQFTLTIRVVVEQTGLAVGRDSETDQPERAIVNPCGGVAK